jgi:hypothetical protein
MLYAVLARGFGMSVRGVLLPEHAFVEIGTSKILEVETTSATGFDWVHDERYYKEAAKDWSSKRGLRPGTIEDYKSREIIEPYRFMARAMNDGRIQKEDQDRLLEIAVQIAPEDPMLQRNALATYVGEGNKLRDRKAWRTLAKMLDVVDPMISKIGSASKDPEILTHVSYLHYYREEALIITNRADEAMGVMDADLKALNPSWPEYAKLRQYHINALSDHLWELIEAKEYDAAIKLIEPRFDLCKSDEICKKNLIMIYHNQYVRHYNAGDKGAARKALEECVQLISNATQCADDLKDMDQH